MPYRPNPMTREGQQYELLEKLYRNTLQAAADAEKDAARYRWLRDKAGNEIMRKLMNECRSEHWDKLIDETIRAETTGEPK